LISRKLLLDTMIYGGGDALGRIVAFVSFPIIAAALSPRAYGALELVLTTAAVLGLVVNCGLNNAVQRYYWDRDTRPGTGPTMVSTGLALQIVFGITAIIIGLVIVPYAGAVAQRTGMPLGVPALIAALILMPGQQWLQYTLDVTRLHFAPFRFLMLSLLSRVLAAVAGVLAVVVWKTGVDGLLVVQALTVLAVLPVALWFIRSDLVWRFDRQWARELIRFGHPFIYAGVAFWLFGSLDRWMLATLSSVEETGIYSVAFRFASIVMFVSAAFGQAWSPYAIKVRTDHPERYRSIYAAVLFVLLSGMLALGGGLALFSGELIILVMPPQYVKSAVPLAILSFGVVLQATQQVTAVGVSLERKSHLFARMAWLALLVNFLANLVLIPRYGAAGAAWATALAYLVLSGGYLWFTQRLHPLPIRWGRLAWILFIGCCVVAVSVRFGALSLEWPVVTAKAVFALLCIVLVLPALPIKDLKSA
jgi:O-antigen/teichoic acid export membrane protein